MNFTVARTRAVLLARTITSRWRPGNVVMFHSGRCGSTILGEMLGDTPRVLWMSELYDDLVATGVRPVFPEPEGHLRYLEAKMVRAGSRYFGFEVRFPHLQAMQLEMSDWLASLDQLGFTHFIVLQRQNTLRTLVSVEIAAKGGPYHQRAGEAPVLRSTRIEVVRKSPKGREVSLLDRLRHREEQYLNLERSLGGRNVLRLTYEEDVEGDPRVGYRRICSFLQIKPHDVPVRLGRTNPFTLGKLIENFDEVRQALDGSQYAWMLEEGPPASSREQLQAPPVLTSCRRWRRRGS